MIRFASLGSGSRGNSLIVDAGGTKLLLDCGFSTRATIEKLGRLFVSPDEISGILVTHEHGDHLAGVFKFACRFGVPVYLTHGTYTAASSSGKPPLSDCHLIDSHSAFAIGELEVQPFPVPHDAREPVQYVVSDGVRRLGVLTDTGMITPHIVDVLRLCDALFLECNHEPDLLLASSYPTHLKRRIAGNFGHLANSQAAALLGRIETRQLQHVVAGHLSEQNNRAELAAQALATELNCAENWIGVACQDRGIDWRQVL